jgi:hypothetical protein
MKRGNNSARRGRTASGTASYRRLINSPHINTLKNSASYIYIYTPLNFRFNNLYFPSKIVIYEFCVILRIRRVHLPKTATKQHKPRRKNKPTKKPPWSCSCYMLYTSFLSGLFLVHGDGVDIFLRKFGWLSTNYMVCYIPEDRTIHNHLCDNLEPYIRYY